MVSGTEIRLNRVMRKGKMLCIPMDHGISDGPIKGLEDPHSVIYNCEEVVSCTGARSTELTGQKIIDAINQIGYQAVERDNFYNTVKVH